MSMTKKDAIEAKGLSIQVYTEDFKNDYISLTDIARYKNKQEPKDVVKNWLRVRDIIEFLGLWEAINTLILKGSNSTPLGMNPAVMHLPYLHKDGWKKLML